MEATITVSGYNVRIHADHDEDGTPFVVVEGLDCNLEGSEPGVYYPTALTPEPV